jgi:O-antigen/teichoic acid export membrane protein
MGRDAVVMLTMRVAGTLLWMIYTITLARSLSQSDFAVVLYVINFSLLAILVITFGRDVALLRFASKAWADGARVAVRKMLLRSRVVLMINGCVLTVLLLGLSLIDLQTPVTEDPWIAVLAGLLTLAAAQMGLNRDCLRAVGRVWQSQMGLNFTRSVIPILGSSFVLLMGQTISAQLALTLFLCSLLLSIGVEELFLRQIDWQDDATATMHDMIEVRRAGLALWPGDIANALMMRSVGLVGALVMAPQTAALLLAAERIAGVAQFPIAASAQAAAPRIAQATNSGDEAVQQALNRGSLLMVCGALIGCVGASTLAWPALWAFGPEYLAAFPTTLILVSASLASAFFGLAQSALNLTGRSRYYSAVSICTTSLTVAGIWFAAAHYGPFEVAVVWSIGWWTANIAFTIALTSVSGLNTGIVSVYRQARAHLKAKR